MEEILTLAEDLKKWVEDVYSYATEEAVAKGRKWTGFKVVEGRSNRRYTDELKVIKAAKAAGYTNIFKTTVLGISDMEKIMGKEIFKEVLGAFVEKPKGKLTLVPEKDKRREVVMSKESEFKEEI